MISPHIGHQAVLRFAVQGGPSQGEYQRQVLGDAVGEPRPRPVRDRSPPMGSKLGTATMLLFGAMFGAMFDHERVFLDIPNRACGAGPGLILQP